MTVTRLRNDAVVHAKLRTRRAWIARAIAAGYIAAMPAIAQGSSREQQIREFQSACLAERQEFARDHLRLGTVNLGSAELDRFDYERQFEDELPIVEMFWGARRWTVGELSERIDANFGRGSGSLSRRLVCAAKVRRVQLSGSSPQPGAAAGVSAASAAAAPRGAAPAPVPAVTPPSPAARPAPPSPVARAAPPAAQYYGLDSREAQALLGQLLGPEGPALAPSMTNRPAVDRVALQRGAPGTAASQRAHVEAQRAWDAARTRRLHNRLNDATACLRVQPTGVISEWGMEGHFRLYNTCSFPVEASWCANAEECDSGRGSLWKMRPGSHWPIFFADPLKPRIEVGACRTDEAQRPPPSDGDIARQGGVSEARDAPQPAPGVSLRAAHRCD